MAVVERLIVDIIKSFLFANEKSGCYRKWMLLIGRFEMQLKYFWRMKKVVVIGRWLLLKS